LAGVRLRESGTGLIGVIEEGRLIGAIDEPSLAMALAEGAELTSESGAFIHSPVTLHPYETGAQALRAITEGGTAAAFVVDENQRLMGVLTPTDLLPRRRAMLRPPMVGGMATPFGVYLTTGTVHGGAKWYGLVATGMLLFVLLLAAQTAGFYVAGLLAGPKSPEWLQNALYTALPLGLFFLGMRLLPLSGTHAAEHQVVHAIERGEDLVPQVVRRMPRVHPRCGTNLAVGLSLFLGFSNATFIPNQELRLLLALVVTVAAWRPIGSLLQYYVTTRPANDRQLGSGIRAGKELLERYQQTRVAVPSIPLRIWNSGVLHVIAGSLTMYGLVSLVCWIFGWPVDF
jgi:hypothetical protein